MSHHSFLILQTLLSLIIALLVLTSHGKCEFGYRLNKTSSLRWPLRGILICFLLSYGWMIAIVLLDPNSTIDPRFGFLLNPGLLFFFFSGSHLLLTSLISRQQKDVRQSMLLAVLGTYLLGNYVLISLMSVAVYYGVIRKGP